MADTLIRIFLDTTARHRKPAQFLRRGAGGWEAISADRALADVERLALGLRELGVARGDRVAILSENRYEWAVADLAVLGQGAVTVPLYPTLTAAQCRALLADSGARVVVVSGGAHLATLRSIADALPALAAVVVLDPPHDLRANEHAFAAVLERGARARAGEPGWLERAAASVGPGDLATVIYTSGTTGEPRGAMLTHGNIASNVAASLAVVDLGPADTSLCFLPLCHIFERMAGLYCMLAAGVTIAYARNMESVGADAMEVRPTVLTGVPRFYEKVHARVIDAVGPRPTPRRALFDWGVRQGLRRARARFSGRSLDGLAIRLADRLVASKVRARVGGRLRICISGGAPLSPQVMEFFFAIGIPVLEGYGLTETSPVISLNPPGRERPGSVGLPLPGIEVRIGEEGEILTRGPHVMRGYLGDDEATRRVIRDGWFHTGDVGRLDADGYLFITDRLKDLIVLAGGKKVAPQPIEQRLKRSPWIAEAVLIGDRRPYVAGLIVPAFAALEAEGRARGWAATGHSALAALPEVRALIEAEVAAVNADLAPYETVKRFALLDRELTQESGHLTPTLKVKRRLVTRDFAGAIEGLYAGHDPSGPA